MRTLARVKAVTNGAPNRSLLKTSKKNDGIIKMKTNMEAGKVIGIGVHAETARGGRWGSDEVLRSLSQLREGLTAWVSEWSQPRRGRLSCRGSGSLIPHSQEWSGRL